MLRARRCVPAAENNSGSGYVQANDIARQWSDVRAQAGPGNVIVADFRNVGTVGPKPERVHQVGADKPGISKGETEIPRVDAEKVDGKRVLSVKSGILIEIRV